MIMDKKILAEDYPFINNILLAYDNYDKSVNLDDDLYQFYDQNIMFGENKNDYKDISVKLLRNLRTLSGDTYKIWQKSEYCIYLYHWLYYKKKEFGNRDLLISTIFNDFEDKYHNGKKNLCHYSKYSNISAESDEIIKLDIFYNNIDAIRDILLMNNVKSYNCRFQEFIHRCVNIYKNLNDKYCLTTDRENNPKIKDICDIVSKFRSVYTSFILNKQEEIEIKLPPLSSTDSEDNSGTINIDGCPSYGNQELNAFNNDQSGSSTLHTVPKILGTMAGISSFMAISYKFTPFRKFLQLRRGAASLSNSLNENEPINLINNESDPWNGSTNNTKYNIGYGSV